MAQKPEEDIAAGYGIRIESEWNPNGIRMEYD
jgi:hypothetical protein